MRFTCACRRCTAADGNRRSSPVPPRASRGRVRPCAPQSRYCGQGFTTGPASVQAHRGQRADVLPHARGCTQQRIRVVIAVARDGVRAGLAQRVHQRRRRLVQLRMSLVCPARGKQARGRVVVSGRGQLAGTDLFVHALDQPVGRRQRRSAVHGGGVGRRWRKRIGLECRGGDRRCIAGLWRAWRIPVQAQAHRRGAQQHQPHPGQHRQASQLSDRAAGCGTQPGAARVRGQRHLFQRDQHLRGVVESPARRLGQRPFHEALPVAQPGGSFGTGFCACWIAIASASSAL